MSLAHEIAMNARPDRARLAALDGVRGVAALLILQLHYVPTLDPSWMPAPVSAILRTSFVGVDLFFALSGYLIGKIVFSQSDAPNFLGVFYRRRALRILPLFGVMLALSLAGTVATRALLPRFAAAFQPDLPWWCYASFTQNLAPIVLAGVQVPSPWFSTSWSLAVEEHFYLGVPLLAVLGSRRLLLRSAVVILLLSPLLRLTASLAGASAMHLYTATPFRLDGLAAGVLVAAHGAGLISVRHRVVPADALRLSLLLLGASVAWFALDNPMRATSSVLVRCFGYCLVAIGAAGLVHALVTTTSFAGRLLSWAPLQQVGIWAYGVYLLHVPVLWLLHLSLLGAPPSLETPASVAITLVAAGTSVALAAASWRCLERPCLTRAHRYRYAESPPPDRGPVPTAAPAARPASSSVE